MKLKDFNPQYITNDAGERISVTLPINEFQKLLEDIEDLAMFAERRDEPTISHEQLITELKRDGLITMELEAGMPASTSRNQTY
jgi:hypothetical protein